MLERDNFRISDRTYLVVFVSSSFKLVCTGGIFLSSWLESLVSFYEGSTSFDSTRMKTFQLTFDFRLFSSRLLKVQSKSLVDLQKSYWKESTEKSSQLKNSSRIQLKVESESLLALSSRLQVKSIFSLIPIRLETPYHTFFTDHEYDNSLDR